jgi:hypothetical protein
MSGLGIQQATPRALEESRGSVEEGDGHGAMMLRSCARVPVFDAAEIDYYRRYVLLGSGRQRKRKEYAAGSW